MITRPLDLAVRLRPPPASLDWLFFVNVGLLVLFFTLFGSRFVLAPGISVDFRIPKMAGANASARTSSNVIRVASSGQILTDDGPVTLMELSPWLRIQAAKVKQPVLLVIASAGVDFELTAKIASQATEAGFSIILAAEEARTPSPGGRR